jgi:hypothetical protein
MPRIRPGPLALVTPDTEGIVPTQSCCTGVEVAPSALLHEWLDLRVPRGCQGSHRRRAAQPASMKRHLIQRSSQPLRNLG